MESLIKRINSTPNNHPDPVPGFPDVVKWVSHIFENLSRIVTYHRMGDKEGVRDHSVLLLQKPISAINTLGNLFLLIKEALPFFKASASYVLPLSQTVGGLGLFLSATQFYLEVTTLRRVFAFESRFLLSSSAPKNEDPGDIKKWAEKIKLIAQDLKKRSEEYPDEYPAEDQDALQKIIRQAQALIDLSPDTILLNTHKELLVCLVQKRDIQTLQHYIDQTTDEAQLERLYRRLGVNFVEEAKEKVANSLKELKTIEANKRVEITEGKALDQDQRELATKTSKAAQSILNSMSIQLLKRKIASSLGSTGAILVFAGIMLSLLGLPWIGLPLLIVGSVLGVGRFLFWVSFSESKDWKPELGAWVRVHVEAIQKALLGLLVKLREGTVAEVEHWASGQDVQKPQSPIPF